MTILSSSNAGKAEAAPRGSGGAKKDDATTPAALAFSVIEPVVRGGLHLSTFTCEIQLEGGREQMTNEQTLNAAPVCSRLKFYSGYDSRPEHEVNGISCNCTDERGT